jgi:heme exporter protein D
VRNEEILHRVKEERKILHTVRRRKGRSDWKTRKNTSAATGQP